MVGIRRQQQNLNPRISRRRLTYLLQHRLALRIVTGTTTGQHQLQRRQLSSQLAGLHHPQWILETIVTGDLQHHRQVWIELKTLADALQLLQGQLAVLFAEGVDTRRHDVLRMGQRLGKLGNGKNTGVVGDNPLPQIFPHRTIGMAGVDVTTPQPAPAACGTVTQQRRRLGVVNNHEVSLLKGAAQLLCVGGIDLFVLG